jgi:hypothetical protein
MTSTPKTPGSSNDPIDRSESVDKPERQEDPDLAKQPEVDPADAGLPSSPELDDETP